MFETATLSPPCWRRNAGTYVPGISCGCGAVYESVVRRCAMRCGRSTQPVPASTPPAIPGGSNAPRYTTCVRAFVRYEKASNGRALRIEMLSLKCLKRDLRVNAAGRYGPNTSQRLHLFSSYRACVYLSCRKLDGIYGWYSHPARSRCQLRTIYPQIEC